MKQTKKNEELQSRREFFKSAAKGALPILALTVLGPTILTSCKKDEDEGNNCRACTNECSGCGYGCTSDCSGSCDWSSH